MDLAPYVESLRQDLAAVAAPAGEATARAADLLAGSLDPAVRLCLLQVLTEAAAELTTKLDDAAVEVRLRDRTADLVVIPVEPVEPAQPAPAVPTAEPTGDVTRITLRLAESLKDGVERAAAAEGVSVNAWLVRAVATALQGPPPPPPPPPYGWPGGRPGHGSRRVTGFAQA